LNRYCTNPYGKWCIIQLLSPPNQSIHIIAGVHGGNLPPARGEKDIQTDR
jgi:hypothetical protein